MATIFIVNHSISGPYAQCFSSYHKTEADAAEAFFECKQSVGEDPALVELIALDTETLDAVTHCGLAHVHLISFEAVSYETVLPVTVAPRLVYPVPLISFAIADVRK
jgi:hypothetical protein